MGQCTVILHQVYILYPVWNSLQSAVCTLYLLCSLQSAFCTKSASSTRSAVWGLHFVAGLQLVMDRTLTPSPWTILMDYSNGLP